jgi:hypothetical protein
MSTLPPVTPSPVVNVTPEVIDLARRRGVEPVLQRLIEASCRIFPTARIEVFAEPDVALEDHIFIVFEVHARVEDLADRKGLCKSWSAAWHEAYPYPRQQPFVLSMHAVSE